MMIDQYIFFLQASGSMLHYSDGNAIASDQVFPSNIIHVHKKCIDWYVAHELLGFN